MEPRTLQYIADAVSGTILNGSPERVVSGVGTDSRAVEPGSLFVALAGERFDAHAFLPQVAEKGAGAILAERAKLESMPGCPVIGVENSRAALGQLAARYRQDFDLPVIVVGGSNGKTTTKELIASVLRQNRPVLWNEASFNNDIGVPLTLLKLKTEHRAAVVEAGTNHPGELAALLPMIRPQMGVITNIGREHLEFFGDLAGVAREEGVIGEMLPSGGRLFLDGDGDWVEFLAKRTPAQVVRVGLGAMNDFAAQHVRFTDSGVEFSVASEVERVNGLYHLRLLGRHQVVNALFAVAIGAKLGLGHDEIARGLAECAPAKMRLQLWNFGGVRVLEDCYNANADSMLAALRTLSEMPCSGLRIAVLGDMGELGSTSEAAHLEVGRQAVELGVDRLLAVGSRAAWIAEAARQRGLKDVESLADVDAAARRVQEWAQTGDILLIKASRAMRLERITQWLRSQREKS